MRAGLLAMILALSVGIGPAAVWAAAPKASLTDIESDVMCVTCREPLIEAQSPQAIEERRFIASLITQGYDKKSIEQALVAQYGSAVLGRPPASGFTLAVYLLPAAAVIVALAVTAIVLPRWRRRTRAATAPRPVAAGVGLSAADQRRLDEELSRFDA